MVALAERTWLSNAKTLATGLGDATWRDRRVPRRLEDHSRQTIKVIGAGLARTGTSSLVVALRRLGFKSYHMFEGVIESGHLQLWYDLAHDFQAVALRQAGGAEHIGSDARERVNVSASAVFNAMATAGFNATTDFPASLCASRALRCLVPWTPPHPRTIPCSPLRRFFPSLIRTYPEALVVLTVRSSGAEWATSVLNTVAPTAWYIGNVAPFSLLETCRNFGRAHEGIFSYLGAPVDTTTSLPPHASLAQSHDDWMEMVRRETRSDRLLLHNAAHDGWEELCAFLVPAFPMVRPACDEVIASGAPYPHVNDMRSFSQIMNMLRAITLLFWASPLLLFLLLRLLQRRCCARRADTGARYHRKNK